MLFGAALEGAGMILRLALILTDISNILRPPPLGTLCPKGARRVEGGCLWRAMRTM